jgi:hypothetical protein
MLGGFTPSLDTHQEEEVTFMRVSKLGIPIIVGLFLALPVFGQQAGRKPVLWHDRGDVSALDLVAGSGGKDHQPGTNFKFIKESSAGSSPKFEVEDEHGAIWKVKLGPEVKSETAATRLLWAAGYFVDDTYYRPQIHVKGLPRLTRGQEFVSGETVTSVRLERYRKSDDSKDWSWYKNPFSGTRELDGLKVMMALLNIWDLKQINNGSVDGQYWVTDVGASFGRTGNNFSRSKGVVEDYAETKFIEKVTPTYVDFVMHSRPFVLSVINFPNYRTRTRMESVVKGIPIAHVRWIGNQLGQLSKAQIRDSFRTAGFSTLEVDSYARVVMQRIAQLKKL